MTILLLAPSARAACAHVFTSPGLSSLTPEAVRQWAGEVIMQQAPAQVTLLDPSSGTLIPADAASPILRWEDGAATTWRIVLSVGDAALCTGFTDRPEWIPDQDTWNIIKRNAGNRRIDVDVTGLGGWTLRDGVSRGTTHFTISSDPVNARLAFIRKPLPFRKAKENPEESQVVVGDTTSFVSPGIVLQDQLLCFNCHTFGNDGSYGMDMDYKGDKGGYLLKRIDDEMEIDDRDIVSWNSLKAPAPAKYSMGLFTLISPDGRWAASTVGEASAFVMLDDLFFSQMFYPATGRIGLLDRATGTVRTLPGADLSEFSQTTPAFGADGQTLAFARAAVRPQLVEAIQNNKLNNEDPRQKIDEVNAKYPVQFDLYHLPFNGGEGGKAEPIEGASGNGRSNFFPRYSPDGKWLVFTQSATGLVLQPDSELWIVPAKGGNARRLAANTPLMNSWHCWSPNSRWLVFSSKGNSPYTELFLTHIDEEGNSSPALRLFRFSHEEMAAMVPEFLPAGSTGPQNMNLKTPEGATGTSMATDGR